jgi:hypothetical protein
MEKLLEFQSRYGVLRTLYRSGPNEYIIEGESGFFRVGEEFVDLQGGPFISLDTPMDMFGVSDERKISSVKIQDGDFPDFYRIHIQMEP